MANLDDNARRGSADAIPRREPPTIEAQAVEVPIDGDSTASAPAASAAADALGSKPARIGFIAIMMARWPLAAAIVAVAAIVIGAALWWALAPSERDGDELRARIALLEAAQRDDAGRLAAYASAITKLTDLSARLTKLEGVAASRIEAPEGQAAGGLAAIEAAVKTIETRLDELDRRSHDYAAAARSAGERVDTVAGQVAELEKGGAAATAPGPDERSTLEGFAVRLDALEARLKAINEQVDGSAAAATATLTAATRTIRAAVVATALRVAVERDYPFTQELDAARMLGLDSKALAALQPFAASGVPTASALIRELSALVPEMLRVSTPARNRRRLFRPPAGRG